MSGTSTRRAAALGVWLLLAGAQAAGAQSQLEGSWEPAPSMSTARAGHTATLLDGPACKTAAPPSPCGDVLVVGGTTNEPGSPFFVAPATSSTELYDPRTGTWRSTGALNTARWRHTATLLADGKVLVTGGRSTRVITECPPPEVGGECVTSRIEFSLASAELYDPARGTWASCSGPGRTPRSGCPGAMAAGREEHTATLLSGTGCGADCGKVLVVGGPEAFTSAAEGIANPKAELYDPATGTFSATGELMQARYQHSATLLPGGKVLVAGGTFPPGALPGDPPAPGRGPETAEAKVSSELYDPATRTWSSCSFFRPPASARPTSKDCPGDLRQSRADHSATLLAGGGVLAAGGASNDEVRITAELYDPASGAWRATSRLNQRRGGHGAALLPSGKLLAAGGRGPGFSSALASAEVYDPASTGPKWTLAPFMSDARGSDFGQPRSVPAVLLSSDAGTFAADPRVCAANCGKVLVVGGMDELLRERLASAELYTPAAVPRAVAPDAAAPPGAALAATAVPAGNSPPATCDKSTTNLSLARAAFDRAARRISVLASITRRASGSVRITLRAAGRTTTFSAPIDGATGRIRATHAITAAQARLATGILTIRYAGDADTRPLTVRVRAADNPAGVRVSRPTITSTGSLRASGTISRAARGAVRVKLEYVNGSDGQTAVIERAAVIHNGRWSVNGGLSPSIRTQIARRCGTLHSYTLFTGYMPRAMRGEQVSMQVLPAR